MNWFLLAIESGVYGVSVSIEYPAESDPICIDTAIPHIVLI